MTLQMKYDEKFEEGMECGIEQGIERGKLQGAILTMDELGYSVSEIAERLNQKEEKVIEILKQVH